MAWLLVALRRLRDDRTPSLGVVILVLVTAFVFAAAPRLLDRIADATLRREVASAAGPLRNIQLHQAMRIDAGEDPFSGVVENGESYERRFPETVAGLIVDRGWVVESPRWRVESGAPVLSLVTMRFQDGAPERIRYVAGRPPTGATRTMNLPREEDEPPIEVTVLEAALAAPSAQAMGIDVGATLGLELYPNEPLARGHADLIAVEIVGAYEVSDPGDRYWFGDGSLAGPTTVAVSNDLELVEGHALLAPEAYPALLAATRSSELPLRYTWRSYVDPERLDAGTVAALDADLRRLETAFPVHGMNQELEGGVTLESGLLRLIDGFRSRWRSVEAVLTVAAVGPAGVAAAALGLVAILAARRRRSAITLSRGRGASPVQVLAAVVAEGLLVTVVPAALAAGAAIVLLPDTPVGPSILAAACVSVLTIMLMVGASIPSTGGRQDPGGEVGVRRIGPRRIAFEVLVVALAVGGAWLLRERGIRGVSATGQLQAADPFIAAVPALVGMAAGLVAVRLLPLPMTILARLASTRRDLVPVLGLRRATRAGNVAPVVLVLLATVAIGAFSSAALVNLDRAADAVAWHEVGAPYRLRPVSTSLPPGFDPAALPGVERVARTYSSPVAVGTRGTRVEMLAIDVADYRAVIEGTPGDPGLPAAFADTGDGPIPAIVASPLIARPTSLAVGGTFDMTVAGVRQQFETVEVREVFPSVPLGSTFVVVPRGRLSTHRIGTLPTSAAFLRASDAAAATLRAEVDARATGVSLVSRAERTAALRASAAVGAVTAGVDAAALIAAGYAILAVAAALALAGAARAIEVAHLRTLGLTGRELAALVVVEHGPTVLVAFAAGAALGLGLFVLLQPGLGLSAIIGSGLGVPFTIELTHLALLLVAVVVVATIGIGLGAALQRLATPATAVRRGFE